MLVVFSSNAYGDITMFGDVAKQLLKMMGHSGTIPSAFYAEDVPAALERLKRAVAAGKDKSSGDTSTGTDNNNNDEEQHVDLAVRAYPLIEMLTCAAEENCNVMWRKK